MNDYPVLGYDLAVYVLPGVVGVLLAGSAAALPAWRRGVARRREKYDDDGLGWGLTAIILAGFAVALAIVTALLAIPFKSQYWTWRLVDAHVESVSNTLRDASGDLTTTPVVTVEGLDRPVTVDDPRIVTLTGQDVTLACKPTWHFRAADTYSCRIYEYAGGTK